MEAGSLSYRVEIQKRVETTTASGNVTVNWVTESSQWSFMKPSKGDERTEGARVQGIVTHKFTMRYIPDLTPDKRLRNGPRVFNIDGITNTGERNRETVVMCQEREGNA